MVSATSDIFVLPKLFTRCVFPLRTNPGCADAARASEQWLVHGAKFSDSKREEFFGLKAGELAASCFPHAHPYRLRVCCDVINYLFNLVHWTREFRSADLYPVADCVLDAMVDPEGYKTDKVAGIMAKDFFGAFRKTSGWRCTRRFFEAMETYFDVQCLEADARNVPDLDSYIPFRRDASGCKLGFVLIEYANGLNLPDVVFEDPIVRTLQEIANDIVSWSNDIVSYDMERARGETRNMVVILMELRGMDIQEAVDHVAEQCETLVERFKENKGLLPSFGEELDPLVTTYIEGLQHWIAGFLNWSFETERYFGKEAPDVQIHRAVRLSRRTTRSRSRRRA